MFLGVYMYSPCHVAYLMEGEFDMAHPHNINYYAHENNMEFQQHNRSSFLTKNTVVLENGQRYFNYAYLYKQYLKDLSSQSQSTNSTTTTSRQLQQKRNRQSKFRTILDTINSVPPLPRLKRWTIFNVGAPWEGKQIMRTEAVRTFFIHYILTKEDSWKGSNDHVLPQTYEAALNHYRLPGFLSGSLFTGKSFYLSLLEGNQ